MEKKEYWSQMQGIQWRVVGALAVAEAWVGTETETETETEMDANGETAAELVGARSGAMDCIYPAQ